MNRLRGRVAFVTGAGSGIGRGCAEALAAERARVVVADVDARAGEETCRAIASVHGAARFLELDVTSEAAWSSAIARVRAEHGALHVLVNNAGICIAVPLLELSYASWRRQLAVNLDGVFLGTKAALPLIAASGGGSIVKVSSVAGLQGVPGLSGYCATKGGVRLFHQGGRSRMRTSAQRRARELDPPRRLSRERGGSLRHRNRAHDRRRCERRVSAGRNERRSAPVIGCEDIAE